MPFAPGYHRRDRIHYELHGPNGARRRVFFIMGILTPGEDWDIQIEHFLKQGDTQCCTIDNRGSGQSSTPWLYTTTYNMARDAACVLQHLGWTRDVHLVSISMGGMIALELACMKAHYFASLTLIATHAGGPRAVPPLWGMAMFVSLVLPTTPEGATNALLPMIYSSDALSDPRLRSFLFDYHLEKRQRRPLPPLPNIIAQLAAVFSHNVSEERLLRLRYSGLSILVIVGTEDWLVRPENSHRLAHALGCRLVVLPDAGHMLTAERAFDVNAALDRHWRAAEDTAHQHSEHERAELARRAVSMADLTSAARTRPGADVAAAWPGASDSGAAASAKLEGTLATPASPLPTPVTAAAPRAGSLPRSQSASDAFAAAFAAHHAGRGLRDGDGALPLRPAAAAAAADATTTNGERSAAAAAHTTFAAAAPSLAIRPRDTALAAGAASERGASRSGSSGDEGPPGAGRTLWGDLVTPRPLADAISPSPSPPAPSAAPPPGREARPLLGLPAHTFRPRPGSTRACRHALALAPRQRPSCVLHCTKGALKWGSLALFAIRIVGPALPRALRRMSRTHELELAAAAGAGAAALRAVVTGWARARAYNYARRMQVLHLLPGLGPPWGPALVLVVCVAVLRACLRRVLVRRGVLRA